VVVSATVQQTGDDRGVVYIFHGPIQGALQTHDANATYFGDDPSFGETLAVLPATDAPTRVAIAAPSAIADTVFIFDAGIGLSDTLDATLRISQSADSSAYSTRVGS
jgi:hypothetical protein